MCGKSGMTQLANAATWRPPTRSSAAGCIAKAVGIAAVALVLSQYLAGYAFLWSIGADPLSATPLTIARYSYYFGDRADVSVRLKIASAAGVAAILLVALPVALPRSRSLHGDARFA